jgi:ribosome-interacting GTPase 1
LLGLRQVFPCVFVSTTDQQDGKGRGRQVIAVARTCNLIFIVLDVLKPLVDLAILTNELEGFGIRLNKKPPRISISKKENGGILITNSVPLTELTPAAIKSVMSEYRINNAQVITYGGWKTRADARCRYIKLTPR